MAIRQCRVCGKEFKLCKNIKETKANAFQWREVACSPECGAEYFRQVELSRSGAAAQTNPVTDVSDEEVVNQTNSYDVDEEETEEEDDLIESLFEDPTFDELYDE